ncbi:MAG: hypothetical protein J6X44_11910 [Thermoguttaceae bacterium]|nr:hypothetical protein [Thermoguttaceae bacterium]
MVNESISSIRTVEELQDYVYKTLCVDNELLTDAFPKSKRAIRRSSGEICGVLFCVHGPRTVDFTAIWEQRSNRILFYGPTGERYRQTTLEGALSTPVDYADRFFQNVDRSNA